MAPEIISYMGGLSKDKEEVIIRGGFRIFDEIPDNRWRKDEVTELRILFRHTEVGGLGGT